MPNTDSTTRLYHHWKRIFCPSQAFLSKFRVAHLIVADLVTDWFHKLNVTGLNNSETISDSPFTVNSKIIPKHAAYSILILVLKNIILLRFLIAAYRIPTPNLILLRILPLSDFDIFWPKACIWLIVSILFICYRYYTCFQYMLKANVVFDSRLWF